MAAVYNVRTARRDNEALTRLAARMFELGDVERGRRYALCAYDDAVAYHSRSRMLEVAPLLAAHLAAGGHAVLSGFVDDQIEWVVSAHEKQGLKLLKVYDMDNWHAVLMEKKR